MNRNIKEWATIFGGLANQNRLKILKLLSKHKSMSVTELAEELEISFKNTSRNLRILVGLNLVEYEGKKDRIYYSLNYSVMPDVGNVLGTFMGKQRSD